MITRALCAASVAAAISLTVHEAAAESCQFEPMPGCATNITSGSNGGTSWVEIVGCGPDGDKPIYRWDEDEYEWNALGGSAVQVSRAGSYLWRRRASGRMAKWNNSTNTWGGWLQNPQGNDSCGSYISANAGTAGVWVVGCSSNPDKNIYFWDASDGWAFGGPQGVQVRDKTTIGVIYEAATMLRSNHTMFSCVSSGGCTNSAATAQRLQNNGGNGGYTYRQGVDGKLYGGLSGGLLDSSPPLNGVVSFSTVGNDLWAVNQAGGIFRCEIQD
jgi:hypothetical protein